MTLPGTRRAHEAARSIATAVLGYDAGPMAAVESGSHLVHAGRDVVVKIIDAGDHTRLDREIALASRLPAGLTAPLLGSGLGRLGSREIRYACYARMPGAAPGMGLPGVDGATARALAEEAVRRLGRLHGWIPPAAAGRTLRDPLGHGGFTGRADLLAGVERLTALGRPGAVPRRLLEGVRAMAEDAPAEARAAVPVHADCHWGNWLADGRSVTALLDFEWARLGEPADDWFFLIRFSGPHRETVLDVVARATGTAPDTLRAECEIREAAHLVSDLRVALEQPGAHEAMASGRLGELEELVIGRRWWRRAG
ncbi:phosphotransferase [Streptomyces sp. CAU 1734]|uniref:phosphotransferase family protein n=1 Tax=Streptomyces sp. CAU 1734 TaxID=3140360 RepID=UPI00326143A4